MCENVEDSEYTGLGSKFSIADVFVQLGTRKTSCNFDKVHKQFFSTAEEEQVQWGNV